MSDRILTSVVFASYVFWAVVVATVGLDSVTRVLLTITLLFSAAREAVLGRLLEAIGRYQQESLWRPTETGGDDE